LISQAILTILLTHLFFCPTAL